MRLLPAVALALLLVLFWSAPSAARAETPKPPKPPKPASAARPPKAINAPIAPNVAPAPSAPAATGPLRDNPEALRAELPLASTTAIYVVFDLVHNKVLLKARGMVLREIPVARARVWGPLPEVSQKPLVLASKKAFSEPRRETIEPKTPEEMAEEMRKKAEAERARAADNDVLGNQPFDIKALEVTDMPSNYALRMEDGMVILVRPGGVFMDGLWTLWRGVKNPVLTLWYAATGRSYRTLEISLKEEDARALYWAFLEGMKCLVFRQ